MTPPPPTPHAELSIITGDPGIDSAEEWSQFWEGKDHSCGVSVIHLSTVRDDEGPPLHHHPYPEVVTIRRGRSTMVIGEDRIEGVAGQTFVIPAGVPHTFRTHGPERYEAMAIHPSPTFLSTNLTEDDGFMDRHFGADGDPGRV